MTHLDSQSGSGLDLMGALEKSLGMHKVGCTCGWSGRHMADGKDHVVQAMDVNAERVANGYSPITHEVTQHEEAVR